MSNGRISEGSIAKFIANFILYVGLILFLAIFYYSLIEVFSIKGLMYSVITLCSTLSIFSILIIAAKVSNYLDKK